MALADTARLIAVLELKDQFSSKLNSADKALSKFDKGFDSVNTRSKKIGTQIGTGLLRLAAAGAAAAGTSAVVLGKAVSAASDLNETVSKVGVVFGKQAAIVDAFGKTSAASLGLSRQAAEEAAATYGNLFVSMGLASDKSADMSIKLVKLAGDLASFNNIDPGLALEKLRAGLTGESEPLKTLGINLNEQTLKAEALRLGLVKLTKGQKTYTAVLTPAVKAQAAYSLIMQQSKTAQGDFARTSGGLANQIRILRANFTDMLATIGAPVLPKVAKIFQQINTLIKNNQPEVAKLGDAIAGLFSDENLKQGVSILQGALETAKATAPIVAASAKATFGFVQAAVGLFKSLPAPLQGLLVGGVALNKLTGGLVTTIAGGLVELIGKARGASPANPVWVQQVGVPGLPGASGGGILGTLGKAALGVTVLGITAEAAVPIGKAFADFLPPELKGPGGLGKSDAQLAHERADLAQKIAGAMKSAFPAVGADNGPSNANVREDRVGAFTSLAGKIKDDLQGPADIMRGASKEFLGAVQQLKHPRSQTELVNAFKQTVGLLQKGRGDWAHTTDAVKALKAQLSHVHDPKTRAALEAQLRKVEGLLPGRQFAARELAKADAILKSHESGNRKIVDLKQVQSALQRRGLIHAAQTVAHLIEIQRNTLLAKNLLGGILNQGKHPGKEKDDRALPSSTSTSTGAHFVSGGTSGGGSGGGFSVNGLFVPTVQLDPSQVKDLRDATAIKDGFGGLGRVIRSVTAAIEAKLPGKQFAARELSKADAILKSNQSTSRKIVGLQEIERALKDRGLPHAADRIRAKEDEIRRATLAAGRNTADAIKRKRLSVTVNNPVTVQTYVSTRTVETTIRKINRFGITVT